MAAGRFPVRLVVIGAVPAGFEAPEHGVSAEYRVLADRSVARFDTATDTWTVGSSDGTTATAPVVVDARPSRQPTVARHGVPNYFRIPGPDVPRQAHYVTRCLRLIEQTGAARIEAKSSVVVHRWRRQPLASRFFLTGAHPGPDDLYDGPARVDADGWSVPSRVRLIGHLDPIDGRYHWQGTVFTELPARSSGLTLTIGTRTARARAVEATPWGAHMIAGVGDPPFG